MAFGLGFIFVPVTLTAVSGVEHRDSGIASAMLNVTQQIGGTIGLAVLVTVFSTAFRNFLTDAVTSAGASGRRPPSNSVSSSSTRWRTDGRPLSGRPWCSR